MFVQQQSVQEDVFPDAEGWENMDPEEAAKWAVGSHFPPAEGEHSQTETGPAAQMHTGITECLSDALTEVYGKNIEMVLFGFQHCSFLSRMFASTNIKKLFI